VSPTGGLVTAAGYPCVDFFAVTKSQHPESEHGARIGRDEELNLMGIWVHLRGFWRLAHPVLRPIDSTAESLV
jgi:hypothetical protein